MTPEQTLIFVELQWSDEYGHWSQQELEAEAIRRAPEPLPPPPTPQYDVDTIRKAYNKVQAAMKAAKDAGDMARSAELKSDYMAIKELLTKANAEQAVIEQAKAENIEKEMAHLREQLATARKTIGMLKTEVSRLDDENRSLRSAPPVEEYRKAQVMPTAAAPTFDMADLMREIDTFAPRNT